MSPSSSYSSFLSLLGGSEDGIYIPYLLCVKASTLSDIKQQPLIIAHESMGHLDGSTDMR